jgi:uncharacterized membrane protein YesL
MNKISMNGLYTLTEWITRFAYVNLLWVSFSLLGLVLFGISPATIAMFAVIRKWLMGESDIPVFRTFWDTYKKEFIKGNGLGIVLALLVSIIFIDMRFMKVGTSLELTHIPLYLIIFTIVMTVMYIFPVYVHYNVKFIQLFKNAFFIMMLNPISNIMMMLGFVSTFFVMRFIPALSIFFGGSISAGIIMASCFLAFQKVEKKQKEAQTL